MPLPPPDTAALRRAADSAATAFMSRFTKATRDSLLAVILSDYTLCGGDPTKISGADQLFNWKSLIDSLVRDSRYAEKLRAYITATGIKAQDVRPCEPIAYAERVAKERRELDSTFVAQKAARDKARRDSVSAAKESNSLKHGPVDMLNIPAGLSRASVQNILSHNKKIKTRTVNGYLLAEGADFKGLTVTVAFFFDRDDKCAGYEIETIALSADRLDTTVREWAAKLTSAYEEKLGGPPTLVTRVSFRDIKQGRLSITASWEKKPTRPRVLVGLATHDNLYYAKAMVSY